MKYDIKLEKDTNNTWLATAPDLPEVAAVGDDSQAALLEVVDAIETAIQGRISDRIEVTFTRRHRKGHDEITLPAQVTIKAVLHNEMLAQNVRKADLARRLHQHMPQVDRLLSVRHNTKLDSLEAALAELGKRLEVAVV